MSRLPSEPGDWARMIQAQHGYLKGASGRTETLSAHTMVGRSKARVKHRIQLKTVAVCGTASALLQVELAAALGFPKQTLRIA